MIHFPYNFGTFDSQSSFCSTHHQKNFFLIKKDEQNNKDRDFDCLRDGLDKRIFCEHVCVIVSNVSEPN